MALEGPRLHYIRLEDETEEEILPRALRLARELEELLEPTRSTAHPDGASAHSTRIARAMAAGLVDELEALTRGLPRRQNLV